MELSGKPLTVMDRMTEFINNSLAPALVFLFERPLLVIIRSSMINVMPLIIFGSLMLLLSLLGTTTMGTEEPIIGFLVPYVDRIRLLSTLTMGLMTLYFSLSLGLNYANEYKKDKLNPTTCVAIGLVAPLLSNIKEISGNMLPIAALSANGLFTTMITTIFSLWIYKLCIKKNLIISLPKGVPPAVGGAFSALIPISLICLALWGMRTLADIDLQAQMVAVMAPVLRFGDSLLVFTVRMFFGPLLWSVGIHADTLFNSVLTPMKLEWVTANAAAKAAGLPLPHVWTVALERTCFWTGPIIGLLVHLVLSKVSHLRKFGISCIPGAIFSIVEPVMFGLPVVMSPYFLIPFVLSGTVGGFITYGAALTGIVDRVFVELPWATPWAVIGFMASGDWKYIVLSFVNVLVGFIIYYPFFKVFQKVELERVGAEEAAADSSRRA